MGSPKTRSPSPRTHSPSLDNIRVLIAPSGFKECLGPEDVAEHIEAGIRRVLPRAVTRKLPLHDGGEGFCKALVAAQGGTIHNITVTGPVGQPVESHFGLIDDNKTAVLDMAAAAGLSLVPRDRRDPTATTTYGVGELLRAALDDGCSRIVIGCGDSGTSDGGAGMLQALGARLIDSNGHDLPVAGGGITLIGLNTIDLAALHPRLLNGSVTIEAVCNTSNVLCGPSGVARVYGPQKGATPTQVELLSQGLEALAHAISPHVIGLDISLHPGSGASGGLGAGLLLLGATLRPRAAAVGEYFGLNSAFNARWDLVVTGEGSLDYQSPKGKMTVEIARRAREHGAQVIALAGTIGEGAESVYEAGIDAFSSILAGPISLEEAMSRSGILLKDAAEAAMRMVVMGVELRRRGDSGAEGERDDRGVLPLGQKEFKKGVQGVLMQKHRDGPAGMGIMRAMTA